MNDKDWFEPLFVEAAHQFAIANLDKFSKWELALLRKAIEGGILNWQQYKIGVAGTGKYPYSLLTINREYFIQFAAFAALIYEYNYPPQDCHIEHESMDIVVMKSKRPFICVETKVKDIEKLRKEIEKYSEEVSAVPTNTRNDGLQKANYIFKSKADYVWLLDVKDKLAFSVLHRDKGFTLNKIIDIPKYNETTSVAVRYYFAYGSNLWRRQMNERCPENRVVGVGILRDYRWMISARGYANIVKSNADEVYGIIYTISEADEQKLDCYEGVHSHSYEKQEMMINLDGRSIKCLVYVDPTIKEGKPKREYIDRINQGLIDAGLPIEYVENYVRKYIPVPN